MLDLELPAGTCKGELLSQLGISQDERGYVFINAVLCDVPGLSAGNGQILQTGDHIGIFSKDRIWPYQYRDGVRMSEDLKQLLVTLGPMHHSYSHLLDEAN